MCGLHQVFSGRHHFLQSQAPQVLMFMCICIYKCICMLHMSHDRGTRRRRHRITATEQHVHAVEVTIAQLDSEVCAHPLPSVRGVHPLPSVRGVHEEKMCMVDTEHAHSSTAAAKGALPTSSCMSRLYTEALSAMKCSAPSRLALLGAAADAVPFWLEG